MEKRLQELTDGFIGDGYVDEMFAEFKRVNGLVNEFQRVLLVSRKGSETVWFVDGVEFKRFTAQPKVVEEAVSEKVEVAEDVAQPVHQIQKGKPGRKPKAA